MQSPTAWRSLVLLWVSNPRCCRCSARRTNSGRSPRSAVSWILKRLLRTSNWSW
ncbi:hypothetical protein PF004_g11670 [Phytophthora fragariae]|uniref:Uncharacterized protein n=1 Tax=Phytophthora fragariae TaxID=53985 RepID=A0A6G0NXB1_9STRA|nr:hypothetical protein PF004_g11670 [Phytophthora fragariae]